MTADGVINMLPEKGIKESHMGQYPNLEQLVALASSVVQTEFAELIEDAERGKALKKAGFDLAPRGMNGTTRTKSTRSVSSEVVTEPTIGVQIALVIARSKDDDTYNLAVHEAGKTLGISRKKNRSRTIGSYFARTQGKHRANFLKRAITAGVSDEVLKDLAAAYSALTGKTVTSEELRAEAGA